MPRDLARSLQRTLAHLKAPPTRGGKFQLPLPTHFRPTPAFVQVKDRIPFWHVAPGDRVKLVKGGKEVKGKVGVVDRVDRETNRVYLKEPEFSVKKRQFNEYPGQQLEPDHQATGDAGGTYLTPRPFHVANLRLQVRDGEHEYTATRVRKSKVTWDRRLRRFAWKRYVLVPELGTTDEAGWRELPWPKEDVPTTTPSARDMTETNTLGTWLPDLSSLSLSPTRLPRSPVRPISLAAGAPPELQVSPLDLGGQWNSRANRTKRYNAAKARSKARGKEVMKTRSHDASRSKAAQQLEAEVLL
ncbi:hypothetical protein Rhopal_002838-T1 [Rhodotorula paludigena]|uniref:KOW domain-containing protein n=1 Tax=Rhodotorula paludigena TaxID=86838 RepID=A0AAV5GIX6_9BASI|nr:hypothetical protein Rhopal_002838-T1 [Rhodotorula paludigena]